MSEDKKIKEWLLEKSRPCPPAPRNEYQTILEKIDKRDGRRYFNLKWGVALGVGFCAGVIIFLAFPYIHSQQAPVIAQNTEEVETFLEGTFTEYVSSFEEDEIL